MIASAYEQELALARDLDAQIREAAHRHFRDEAEHAYMLQSMNENRRFGLLDYPSIHAYAFARFGYGTDKTKQLLRIVNRLEERPVLRAAFQAKELDWTKVKRVSQALEEEPEREVELVEEAKVRTIPQLNDYLRRPDDDTPVPVTFKVNKLQRAMLEDLLRAVRQKDSSLSRDEAFVIALTRAEACGVGNSKFRILVNGPCPNCGLATRPSREGPVVLEKAHFERLACDAELLELGDGIADLTRKIRPRVANCVNARDQGRCVYPGCPHSVFVNAHHEGGWLTVGHDPDRILTLCTGHHADRHDGRFTIRFEADGPHFYRPTGEEILAPGS
jgi:hypothetical protein